MKYLYAPWRGTYATAVEQKKPKATDKSIFATQFEESQDDKNLILRRFTHVAVLLNLYPYNPGHLLVMPLKQVENLDAMPREALHEFMETIATGTKILKEELKADGINIGLNLGDCSSGGSIPGHLHAHLIPRWRGDTGFLPLTAETKVLSEDLRVVYKKLKPAFDQLKL